MIKNNINIIQLIIIFKIIMYFIIINKIDVLMIVSFHNLNNQLKIKNIKMVKVKYIILN